MIINVRGTSGSGKSTAVRGILTQPGGQQILWGESGKKPDGYSVSLLGSQTGLIYVVGSYENVCGGCDGIKTQDEICERVRRYARLGHVIMEGLLMSTLFDRYRQLDRDLTADGHKYIWAFLDTPLDVCLQRVGQRREARGTVKPLNPKNTTDKWHLMSVIQKKCRAAGLDVRVLDHTRPSEQILEWLCEA